MRTRSSARRPHRGHRDLRRGPWSTPSRRQHGRGRRRKDHPRHRARDSSAAAGGDRPSSAAPEMKGRLSLMQGEDQRRAGPPRPARACPTSPSHRSDDGRRDGEFRDAGATSTSRSPRRSLAFAGPRVSNRPPGRSCPRGFQRSEFLLEHGMLDLVVDRRSSRRRSRGCCASRSRPRVPRVLSRRRSCFRHRRHARAAAVSSATPLGAGRPDVDSSSVSSGFGMKFGLANIAALCAASESQDALPLDSSSQAPTARGP